MKKVMIFAALLAISFASCKKDDVQPAEKTPEKIMIAPPAVVSGEATIAS